MICFEQVVPRLQWITTDGIGNRVVNSSIPRIDSLASTQRLMKFCMMWNPPSSLVASTFALAYNYSIRVSVIPQGHSRSIRSSQAYV